MKDAKCVVEELELLKKFCEENIAEATTVSVCRVFEGCRVAVVDAIKLIEEQDERIAIMTEGKPEVVMCKDCKYGEKTTKKYREQETYCNGECMGYHSDNWFCADGKRKL